MLDKEQAKQAVEAEIEGTTANACVEFNSLFIVRVDHEDGTQMDPFFSVDPNSGEVKDFSVLEHIDELTPLFAAETTSEDELIQQDGQRRVDDILGQFDD